MAEDWALDVKKYDPAADDNVIDAIVKYCGIALRTRDASLVSFTDKEETDRVRDNYCRKKLGLTDPDDVIDAAIAEVGEIMKGDNTRNRVTVYYLLAKKFGKLGLFGAVEKVVEAVAAPVAAAVAAAPVAAAAPLAAAAVPAAAEASGSKWWLWLLGLLALAALLWWLFGRGHQPAAEVAAPVETAPAVTAPAVAPEPIPEGAGITAADVDGKPSVSVYFDTAKTEIYPTFDARTEALRKYAAEHPDEKIAVSGYNDPRGDAAMNAELSKNRAKAVRDALVKLGVPEASILLVKPADTTDTTDSLAQARRVDISFASPETVAAEAAEDAAKAGQ